MGYRTPEDVEMEDRSIELRIGLPESHRRAAAEVYYDAFREILQPALQSRQRGIRVLQQIIDPNCAIVAIHDGELIGLAGILHHGRHFLRHRALVYTREYRWISGLVRFLLLMAVRRRPRGGEILIECVAVISARRSRGVGTQLVEAVFQYARTHGFRGVRLEVVDTNPRARRLYERLGFVAVSTQEYPLLRHVTGFSAATTMVKRLDVTQQPLRP